VDPLAELFPTKAPRSASVAETNRFRKAFNAELRANPDRPPGPSALARQMGLSNTRNLNGRLTKLRIRMLVEAGFKRDDYRGRWYKP
jgi:hypothetical protein